MNDIKKTFHALMFAHYIRRMEAAFDMSDLEAAANAYSKAAHHGKNANMITNSDGYGRDPVIDIFMKLGEAKVKYKTGKISEEEYTRIWDEVEQKQNT